MVNLTHPLILGRRPSRLVGKFKFVQSIWTQRTPQLDVVIFDEAQFGDKAKGQREFNRQRNERIASLTSKRRYKNCRPSRFKLPQLKPERYNMLTTGLALAGSFICHQ